MELLKKALFVFCLFSVNQIYGQFIQPVIETNNDTVFVQLDTMRWNRDYFADYRYQTWNWHSLGQVNQDKKAFVRNWQDTLIQIRVQERLITASNNMYLATIYTKWVNVTQDTTPIIVVNPPPTPTGHYNSVTNQVLVPSAGYLYIVKQASALVFGPNLYTGNQTIDLPTFNSGLYYIMFLPQGSSVAQQIGVIFKP